MRFAAYDSDSVSDSSAASDASYGVKPALRNGWRAGVSDSDDGSAWSESDEEDRDLDSEDELWPLQVDPPTRRPPTRLNLPIDDVSDRWLAAEARAKLRSAESAKASFGADMAALLQQQRSLQRDAQLVHQAKAQRDIEEISALLENINIQRQKDDAKLLQDFEARTHAVWEAVNQTIAETESLNQQRHAELQAAAEAERLRVEAEERERHERAEAAAKRQKEAADRAEAERKAKADAEVAARKEQEAVAAVAASEPAADSPEAFWLEHMSRIQRIKADILPAVSSNPAWSRACREAKRTMTTKTGQVTNSSSQIRQVTQSLAEALAKLQAVDMTCYRWGLNHLSKCLIKQAETELVSRSSAAFPLGRVVCGLMIGGHPELGDVLFARLVKKCFWLTGWYPRRTPDMDEAAHQKLLGHAPPTSGETSGQYADRMAGIVSLWAAIVQTRPDEAPQCEAARSDNAHHDVPVTLRPDAGWRWLATVLNGPLVSLEPAPRLLNSFLQIAGPLMAAIYRKQLRKVAKLVASNLDKFAVKAKPAVVRLQLQLDDFGSEFLPVAGRQLDDD